MMITGNTVRLVDGTEVDSASPAWRHECEARQVLGLATLQERRDWLYGRLDAKGEPKGGMLQKRGLAAVKRMEATMQAIWNAREAVRASAAAQERMEESTQCKLAPRRMRGCTRPREHLVPANDPITQAEFEAYLERLDEARALGTIDPPPPRYQERCNCQACADYRRTRHEQRNEA